MIALDVVRGRQLRDLLVEILADGVGRTSHELHIALLQRGLQAPGADYKGRIRNIHSAASLDKRIARDGGVFTALQSGGSS